jgi:tetratricopeptide (TPR) repeat protein
MKKIRPEFLALALLSFFAVCAGAQQVAVPVVTAVPAAQKDAAPPPKTEADKRLDEIMKPSGGALDTKAIVPQLAQFIRENPDYPRLEMVYTNALMLSGYTPPDPEKTIALADEAMAKYPGNQALRGRAISAKFAALRAQKKDEAVKELQEKLLETETSPAVLQAAAQGAGPVGARLFEKAIAERGKDPSPTASPTLDSLRWSYATSLRTAGRNDEALKLSLEIVEENRKAIAEIEALPKDDPKRKQLTLLKMNLGSRYSSLGSALANAGEYQKALDYVTLSEQGADNPLEGTAGYATRRAVIYAKMGKPDLELDCYVQGFAARMDFATRDKIRDLSKKADKNPDEAYTRARELRAKNALDVKGFELKTLDGGTATLDSLKRKATIVNFFFPT